MRAILLWVCACSLGAALGAAPASADVPLELQGRRVVAVEVGGPRGAVASERDVGLRIGAEVSRRTIRATVRRLLETGRWADVQIDLVPERGGVRVVAVLTPKVVIARVEIVGNEVLDDAELRRAMQVTEGGDLSIQLALDDEEDGAPADPIARYELLVREAYGERGYDALALRVTLRDTDDPSRKVLHVSVDEGEPTEIAAVLFEGDPPPRESRAAALLLQAGDELNQRELSQSVREAEARLRARGWLAARLGPARFDRTEAGAIVILPSYIGRRYTVEIRGPAPLTRGDVYDAMEVGEERLTAPGVVESMRQRVLDQYRRLGFSEVEASVRTIAGEDEDHAVLVVSVEPGRQVRVVGTTFAGARHFERSFLRDQVAAFLDEELERKGLFDPVDDETLDAAFSDPRQRIRRTPRPVEVDPARIYYPAAYARAIEHLTELYEADGYLGVQVGPARLTDLGSSRARVDIPIVEGPRSMLHRLDVAGHEALTSRAILTAAGLTRDEPFSYLALERAVSGVTRLYQEQGYYYVRVEPDVRFSGDRTRTEVTLRIVERFQVIVGQIQIEGADRTSERLIARVLPVQRGDLLRPSLIRNAQDRLMELGVFSGVSVAPLDADLPARVKSLTVSVSERRNQYVDFRAGISTGQGVRGDFEYGYRNLFGWAVGLTLRIQIANQFFFLDPILEERFEALSLLDRLERRITASLVMPYVGIRNLSTTLSLSHSRENERNFGLDKNAFDLTFAYRYDRNVSISLSGDIENNDVDLLVDDETYQEILAGTTDPRLRRLLRVPQGRTTLVASSATLDLDYRDNPFTPRRGFLGSATVEWARTIASEELLVGDTTQEFFSHHVRGVLTATGYIPIGESVVFAVQGKFGRVFHLQDRSETYPNRQFFLGGVDNMRGYLQDAMIPQDLADEIAGNPDLSAANVVQGGDTFIVLRGELRFPIFGGLHGGLFADLGNLWAEASEFNPLDLRPTAGIGLRLQTPVGPIAFDYGFVLLRRENLGERFGAFHFSIGLF